MDYYKSESEFIDSLDFLSPPVKRLNNSRELFGVSYNGEPNNIQLFRGIRRKFGSKESKQDRTQQNKTRRIVKPDGKSSTSLVLEKTSETKILRQYTVLSYTNLHSSNLQKVSAGKTCSRLESKDKPLIKVTVIPKTDQVQTAKLLRKRRNLSKRVQSTTSNQENSIKTKNLYLVVAGRKNKIYEIKTTGSATFSSDQKNINTDNKHDISIEGLSNVKHLIESLNMDQRNKKVRNEHNVELKKVASTSKRHEQYEYESKGVDPYESEEQTHTGNLEGGKRSLSKSRVRIYGQLGLTEDDRYFLRYGATVNNKPVTDFAQLTQDFLPEVLPTYDACDECPGVTKEASVQANCQSYNVSQHPVPMCGFVCRKASQGTQVNFRISVPVQNRCRTRKIDKDIQCICSDTVEQKPLDNGSTVNCLKEGSSPLVIISVYPKQPADSDQRQDVNALYVPKLNVDRGTNRKIRESRRDTINEKKITPVKKNTARPSRSRSPTPIRSISTVQETTVNKTQTDTSPERFKALKMIKNKILEKDKNKQEAPATSKIASPVFKSSQRSKPPARRVSPIRSREKSTNTEHAKAKKNLVDNYTKQVSRQTNKRDTIPMKLDNSRVTINIEGEQEYYNVLFDQSKLSTDLRVNKRFKNVNYPKRDGNASPSLENFLIMPEKEAYSQRVSMPFYDKQFDDDSLCNKPISGMTIRDSLEISHRREDHHQKHLYEMPKTQHFTPTHRVENTTKFSDFLAPIKHYTGDDCSICDPIERDKQIRELLGVNKSKYFAPKSLQAHPSENDEYPLHCFFRRECEKRQLTEINLVKYCPILGSLSKCPGTCCLDTVYKHNNDDHGETTRVSERTNKKLCSTNFERNVSENNETLTANTDNSAIYQQLILNRNIQIFLQVEPLSKHRPIVLSRKQYDKVKKTIQTTLSNRYKEKCKKHEDRKFSYTSMCKVIPKRNKDLKIHCDKEIQTEVLCVKNSFQKPIRRPRMVSKMRYLAKAPRPKLIKEKLLEDVSARDPVHMFEDLDEYYRAYQKKVARKDISPHQTTGPVTILYPFNSRPRLEYSEITNNETKLQQHRIGRLNAKTEIQNIYTKYMPRTLIQKQNGDKSEIYRDESCRLGTGEHRKLKNECRKQCERQFNPNENVGSKTEDHHRIINKCDKGYRERYKSDKLSLKQNSERQNEEQCKVNKTVQSSVMAKYSIGCGKGYKPNKECLKKIEKSGKLNDIGDRDTKEHTPNAKCSQVNEGYGKSIKKNCKSSGLSYTSGLFGVNLNNQSTSKVCPRKSGLSNIQSREYVIRDLIQQHKGCGEYNIESEGSRPKSLQFVPASGKYQKALSHDIGTNHSFHSQQNTETQVNNVTEVAPITKWEHFTFSNQREHGVIEHNNSFEDPKKTLFEDLIHNGNLDESIREHPRYNAMNKKNETISNPRFEDKEYQKPSRISEKEPPKVYSDPSTGFQHYVKHDSKTENLFEQNREHCRLDVKYDTCIKVPNNSDRSKERSDLSIEYIKQLRTEEQMRSEQDRLNADLTNGLTMKSVSSIDIHYTMAYLKRNDSIKSDVAVHSDSSLCHINSIQTIFRGHRKSPTPNLGTSMYSLYSDGVNSDKSAQFIMAPRDEKPKRPFLRRLMSCLVMRSARASILNLPTRPPQQIPSVNSSIDSYHISTSLGAVEVSSSIYDTSASFYSNHTILPINSKIKRGFFNSVRGFLTNRKS